MDMNLNMVMPYFNSKDKELEVGDQVSIDLVSVFNVGVIRYFSSLTETVDCEMPDGSMISVSTQLIRENISGQHRKRKNFVRDVVDIMADI